MLVDRRDYPVLDVIDGLASFAQPELLATQSEEGTLELGEETRVETWPSSLPRRSREPVGP
jgi:hypothetical protein